MTGRLPIVLDCDPGIDDTFAILTAAHHGRLLGITTVNGTFVTSATRKCRKKSNQRIAVVTGLFHRKPDS